MEVFTHLAYGRELLTISNPIHRNDNLLVFKKNSSIKTMT